MVAPGIRKVEVVRKTRLNGTIDGHDPLVAVFRILGPQGWFRLTVVTVNWGRGYKPDQFKANVERVLEHVEEREYVVILMQEIDEADPSPEHKIIRKMLPKGTHLVEWWTREPIAVYPGVDRVGRERKTMTMDQGSEMGAPHGTGPRRFITSCIIVIEGVRIGVWTQHPHRIDPDWTAAQKQIVATARRRGVRVTRMEVAGLVNLCDLTIGGGDMNDREYPKTHPAEKVAYTQGLDTIRYVLA